MSKDTKPETITVTATDLSKLLDAAVEKRVIEIMTARNVDEKISDALEKARGIGRPLAPEYLVPCVSPLSGARFVARLIMSRNPEIGARVVELLEYQRPDGWDRKKADGGIVPDGDHMPLRMPDGQPGKKYLRWLREEFLFKDSNALNGKPLPKHWRAENADPAPGSVTLTPDQLTQLGITAEQIHSALEPKAAE